MIYIMVHQRYREFKAKLLLAYQATLQWNSAVIGKTSALRIYLPKFPSGTIIDLAYTPERAKIFKDFRAWGHYIVSYDEEASAMPKTDFYVTRRFNQETLESVEFISLWGEWHRQLVPDWIPTNKLVMSGHPRLEVNQPKWQNLFSKEEKEILKQYPSYVLINTNTLPYKFEVTEEDYKREVLEPKYKKEKESGVEIPIISFDEFKKSAQSKKIYF